ncbi:hypothetical protein QTP70_005122 [Hemibagrus guttatus]|uniref:Uncharacterized protein n=1 Tax=Hemibagrus guttatus TaxID=175788 RepID=A0AAE0Q5J7_9TELE|nr:hypothetical protein QTP70_005122 [Hemibagrus guttatus]
MGLRYHKERVQDPVCHPYPSISRSSAHYRRHMPSGFYSWYFIVSKRDRGLHPVLFCGDLFASKESAVVLPLSSSPSGPGCSGADLAEAASVRLYPGCSAPTSPSQCPPRCGPPPSSGSPLARSSLVHGPCLPPRRHSLGDSHQGRSPLSGTRGDSTPLPRDVKALGLAPHQRLWRLY